MISNRFFLYFIRRLIDAKITRSAITPGYDAILTANMADPYSELAALIQEAGMAKYLIVFAALVLLIISFVGCTKIVKIPMAEVQNNQETMERMLVRSSEKRGFVVGVELASDIVGVALSPFEIYYFDTSGAKVDPESMTIYGLDISGNHQIRIPIEDIRRVIHADRNSDITFNRNKGKFNEAATLIVGIMDDGKPIEVSVDDVLYLKVRKPDQVKTFFLIGVPTAVIFAIALRDSLKEQLEGILESFADFFDAFN